jgi:hypothetical protein
VFRLQCPLRVHNEVPHTRREFSCVVVSAVWLSVFILLPWLHLHWTRWYKQLNSECIRCFSLSVDYFRTLSVARLYWRGGNIYWASELRMIIFRSSGAVNVNGLDGISVETRACHVEDFVYFVHFYKIGCKKKLNSVVFSPQANYTDRATAACRRSEYQLLRIECVAWSAQQIPPAVNSVSVARNSDHQTTEAVSRC